MKFNAHADLAGSHAFLGASKYYWVNYDDDRLIESYHNYKAIQRGTELHAFAAQCIRLQQRLPDTAKTLNQYVNDAIGFHMTPEQMLYYSPNCYGTADAIAFRDDTLRVHDLKTGYVPAHMEQLMIYAALFCLEYKVKPISIATELRLYQNDTVEVYTPEPSEILALTDKIIYFDKVIESLKREEGEP